MKLTPLTLSIDSLYKILKKLFLILKVSEKGTDIKSKKF